MDGGAWWAVVHGVAGSWTRLSDFIFTFHFHVLGKKWQPTPVFLPGESQGWGSLVGWGLWGYTELDTTEAISSSGSHIENTNLQRFINNFLTIIFCQDP